MSSDDYIWICRWADFQHYRPERDRAPAWIKDYTKQMSDERYLQLSDRCRALLGDLRRSFAVTSGRLPRDTRVIARHRHRQTFRADLDALNHAGFIEFVSRETLDQRLEELYSSPRVRVEVEVEREVRKGRSRENSRYPCPICGINRPTNLALREHIELVHDLTPDRILSEDT